MLSTLLTEEKTTMLVCLMLNYCKMNVNRVAWMSIKKLINHKIVQSQHFDRIIRQLHKLTMYLNKMGKGNRKSNCLMDIIVIYAACVLRLF